MGRSRNGSFYWYDILTTDVDATSNFYAAVLPWSLEDAPSGGYRIARADGRPVAGVVPLGGEASPHWLGQIISDDVEQLCRRLAFLQGEVLIPPEALPDVGTGAMIADPAGAVLHAFTPQALPDEAPALTPGCVGFHAMLAPRADLACRVYKTLFPWKVGKNIETEAGTWTLLKERTTVVAAALERPAGDHPPQWVHYVIVPDLDATQAAALEAGASAIHPPVELPKVGRLVTLVDPAGALFGLMQAPG